MTCFVVVVVVGGDLKKRGAGRLPTASPLIARTGKLTANEPQGVPRILAECGAPKKARGRIARVRVG